jgi:putative transposase
MDCASTHADYHVTCRGNERKAIFRDDTYRSLFLDKLNSSREIYRVEIHCYVLMNNHFHLVVETPRGNLSEFMRHFNNRRHRGWVIFIKRFKAILIDKCVHGAVCPWGRSDPSYATFI